MPANGAGNAPSFRERLWVPFRWWALATVGVAIGGAEVFAGFDWHVVVLVYLGLGAPTAAILLAVGHVTVTVDDAGLHERGRTLRFDQMLEVRRLDHDQTRRQLGPAGDRSAHLVARSYVPESVAVRTTDDTGVPYWLVSSRRPAELAAALSSGAHRTMPAPGRPAG